MGLLTKEQENFLRENVEGKGNLELLNLLKENFEINITAKQLQNWRTNHRVISKSPVPSWKKGKKAGVDFKPYRPSKRRVPPGTEMTTKRDEILVKTENEKWIPKQRFIWEQHYGELPKNKVVTFLNGDKKDFNIKNLAVITRKELAYINKQKFTYYNEETKNTAILLAKIGIKNYELLTGGKENSSGKKKEE